MRDPALKIGVISAVLKMLGKMFLDKHKLIRWVIFVKIAGMIALTSLVLISSIPARGVARISLREDP